MDAALDRLMIVANAAYGRCRPFIDNFSITGSLAYNKEKVTMNSDLELLSIVDFDAFDIRSLFGRLGVSEERVPLEYLVDGRVNMLRVFVPNFKSVETHITLIDERTFDNIVNLTGSNLTYKTNHRLSMRSNMRSPRGQKETVIDVEYVPSGLIIKTSPYQEIDGDSYIGSEVIKLLLNPRVVEEGGRRIERKIDDLNDKLKEKLQLRYGNNREGVSMLNALVPQIVEKLTPELRHKFETFF